MKTISRRDFLKGALAGTASVAAAGILGACASGTDAATLAATAAETTAAPGTEAPAATTAASPEGLYIPGTYQAQADGKNGPVTVSMTFDANSITDAVVDVSREDPPNISDKEQLAASFQEAILAAQSAEFDAVAGASDITSPAVAKAAAKCIAQAKGEIPIEVITDNTDAGGKRFFNESGTYEGILHADEYQKGHCHYTLFDSNWTTYAQQFKMHGCSRLYPFENGADPNIPFQAIEGGMLPGLIESGFVVQADTVEELAEKLGLPADELKATVDHYNELAHAGEDTDFGKEAFRLTPVDTAPFYGAKNTGYVLCTMDGIQIDTSMNAIDTEGNPIPGLYVVGNDSGCYFANTYPNLSTGMACGRTVTFGRLLGKQLAQM